MKKLFNNSLVLATILATSISLQAEVVELSEVGGGCPSIEIDYLSNLTTHTYMEGVGTINSGWDADKYSFTPAMDGILKVHLKATGQELSMKIDTVCNGSGLFRSTKKADHEEQEFTITADQTIEIALWDWAAGSGYAFDLNVEFTPDDATGEVPSKVSILQSSTSVGEGDTHTYTLSLDKPSSTDTTVTVAIEHATTSDDDVLEETRDITILAGETTKTFTVDTIDDTIEESSESFTLSISQTDNTTVIVNPTSNSVTTIIIDDDGTTGSDDLVVYEDAQNANTAGWANLSLEAGRVTNITDVGSNRVIKLTGSTTSRSRAAYTFKNDNGTLWNSTQNFIAKWDMKTDDDYEIFFIAKSSDNSSIDNYIGYVSKLPTSSNATFNSSTGYWSSNGSVLYGWGRYIYIILGDTLSELTTITKDLYADATDRLGITLTSIESMHVNVYGTSSATLLLDNISLQKELTVSNTPPVANAQSVSVDRNSTVNITLTGIDSDDDNLTYIVDSSQTAGTLTGEAPNLVYTPAANVDATDSFTFKVNDGTVDSEIVTVSITINAVTPTNTPPVATEQSITIDEDTNATITLTGTDVDDNNLTFAIVDQPSNGSVTLDGITATYTPNANFFGTDSFTFKANDGTVDSAPATISITVNDVAEPNTPPVATEQSITIDEDTNATITLTGTDVDDNNLTFAIVDQPSNGSVTLDGITATYTPDANFFGTDSFTFRANDGIVNSAPAAITITVNDVAEPNNAPVAEDKNVSLNENSTLDITLVATDSDDDNLTYSATQPSNGYVTIEGAIATYTPNSDYNGTDSFTFKANDGTDDSNTATVNITVIDIPITNSERTIYEDAEDGNTTGWVIYDNDPTGAVVDNIFDTDKNSNVIEFVGIGTTNGYRLGNNSGLTGDWNNTTQFNINWSMKSSERYKIFIRVETDEGWRYLQYTNSDSDLGKRDNYIRHGLGSDTTDGSWRSFTRDLQADLQEFEPNNNIIAVNSFLIRGSGRVDDISLFTSTTTPQNIVPISEDQNVSMNENDTLEITLVATDENNDTLTYSVEQPSNGLVTISGAIVTYTPNANYDGTDSFTFQANDGNASSNIATVNIVINNVPNIISVTEDENLSEHFLGMTIDVTGDKTIVNGTITSDWDVDRYSFNADNLGETKITLKDSAGANIPFYVIRNYNNLVTGTSEGIYDLGIDFSVITIMIVAESNTTSTYTLTIEAPNTEVSDADLYANWIIAKNGSVHDLSIALDSGNIAKVLTNKPIDEDNTSQTDAIYGTITGHTSGFNELTTFNINSGYKSGTKIIVRVYDPSGNILATSSEYSYTKNENINYGDLTF